MKTNFLLSLLLILIIGTTTAKQTYAQIDAGDDQTIYSDTTRLNGNTIPGAVSFWWVIQGAGEFDNITDPKTVVRNIAPGVNVFRWACKKDGYQYTPGYDDVTITNNSEPAFISKIVSCNTSVLISGTHPESSGHWTIVSGSGTIVNETLYNTEITNLQPSSTLVLNWNYTENGTPESSVVKVSCHKFTVNAGADAAFCGDSYKFAATHPANGVGYWSNIGNTGTISNYTSNVSEVSGLGQGTNVFRWTVARNGCMAFDDISITNNLPDEAIIISVYPQNSNTSLDILAVNPSFGTGFWTIQSGAETSAIDNSTLSETFISGLNENDNFVLRWTVNTETCSDFEEVTVIMTENTVYAGADVTTCDSIVQLSANHAFGATAFWSVIAGSGTFDNINVSNTKVRNLSSGENIFRWTKLNPETQTIVYDDIKVIYKGIKVDAGENQELIWGITETMLNASELPDIEGATGSWDVVAGSGNFEFPTQPQTLVSGLSRGMNIFRWTVFANGCASSGIVEVIADYGCIGCGHGPIVVCEDSVELNASAVSGATCYWSLVSGNGIIDDIYSRQTTVYYIGGGSTIFQWNVCMGQYFAYSLEEVINAKVTADAGSDILTCENETYIAAGELNEGETGAWTIAFGGGNVLDPTSNITLVSGYEATTYMNWTVSNEYCTDVDVMIITYCNSIDYQEMSAGRLYPNPATHFVTLISEAPINSADIRIFNTLGQKIELNWEKSGGNTLTTDVQNLPAGIYFIKITSESIKLIIK